MCQKETGPARDDRGVRRTQNDVRATSDAAPVNHLPAFTQGTIHAELLESDTAIAFGVVVKGSAPVLTLCRKLVELGVDVTSPMQAWRGDVLCLHVRSIGEAAELAISGPGTGFCRATALRIAPPVGFEGSPYADSPPSSRRAE